MYDVQQVKGFAKMFPVLTETRKTIETPCYDKDGNLREMYEADKAVIAELNERGFDVWFVMNSIVNVGKQIPMTAYAVLGKEDGPYSEDNADCIMLDGDYAYILCDVFNPSWDIEEMGSIVAMEKDGKLIRIG